jgi:hypothetical protein
MANWRRGWTTFAQVALLVVGLSFTPLVSTLTGMPWRLVGAMETVVTVVLVFLYAAFWAYIRPLFAPNKDTGKAPPENPTP